MKAHKPRALVVEDDPSWQQILHENLSDAGLEVDVAGSLENALAFLRSAPHRVAVLDLSLQTEDPHNQDGLRVLDAIQKVDPSCAAILLTGFATVELAVSVLKDYHALSCLQKEAFQRSQFLDLIRQAMSTPPSVRNADRQHVTVPAENELPLSRHAGQALVVEDDAGWRGILAELLLDAGFQVRLCRSYGEAFGLLRREKFRLAVVDLSLSGSSAIWDEVPDRDELEGYRLLTSTREAGIPTLVVSGVGNLKDIERTYQEQGIFAYIEKQSFDRRAFVQIVQEAQQAGKSGSALDSLSDREREVLDLVSRGKTNRDIAEALVISENTVKRHLKSVFKKLDIHTRAGAAAFMAKRGED